MDLNQKLERKREYARKLRANQTDAERRLGARLANYQLGVYFVEQAPLFGYIADFYCSKAMLIIEVDGGIHSSRKAYDAHRDRCLKGYGYSILRFTNDAVEQRIEHVLKTIRDALLQAGIAKIKPKLRGNGRRSAHNDKIARALETYQKWRLNY